MANSEGKKRPPGQVKTTQKRKRKPEYTRVNAAGVESMKGSDSTQEEKYMKLVQNIPCAVYSAYPGKAGPTTFMSNKWKDWTGYSPDELYQDPEAWPKCIHPDDREKAVNAYCGACKDVAPYNLEYRIIHKDTGQIRYVRDQGHLSKDEKGAVIKVDGIVEDITERKRMENLVGIERDLVVELGNTTGLQEGLRICLEAAIETSEMDCGGIYLVDEASGSMELAFHKGLSPEFVASVSHCDKDSPKVQLVSKGELVYTEYEKLGVPLDGNEQREGLKAIVVVPMIDKGQVIGCMNVASHSHDVFPAWSRAALETVTAEIGSMIRQLKAEEAVLEERDRAQKYLDVAAVMFVALDSQGNVTLVNKRGRELLGWDEPEIVGKNWFENFQPENTKEQVKAVFLQVITGKVGPIEYYENPILCRDGSQKVIAWHNTVLKDGSGNIIGTLSSGQDITERKQAEEALRESKERLSAIVEKSPIPTAVGGSDGSIMSFNKALEELTGYRRTEINDVTDWTNKLYPDQEDRDFIWKNIQQALRGEKQDCTEFTITRKDGSTKTVDFYTSFYKDGLIIQMVDITKRKRAEKRLLDHQAQLKSLASQLSLTEERERYRLATELHDHISQSLVISKVKLDQLRKSSASDELTKALEEICNYLGRIIDDTRTLTFDLSYPILYELGFEAAVSEWLADEIQEKHGIETEFENDGQLKPLDEDIRMLLFRDVRELLVNIVKHAQAHKVKVSVRRVDGHIHVSVEDDGVGFDPVEMTSTAAQKAKFGLFSIRERLEQLGGLIEIESEPGHGSKITMTAPLKYDNSTDRTQK